MKYYIIAGEASGDLHGANLIKAILLRDPAAIIRARGGDLMRQAGAELVKHYKDVAYMGFFEVALHLRTILRNMKECKKDLLKFKPDAVIFIDYPGFNLPVAKFAHKHGLRTYYYISPQVWAWNKNRVYDIKKNIDKTFVILPFEPDFFKQYDYEVQFVGHPLLDAIANDQNSTPDIPNDKPIIALLPGSRKQEIRKMLPVMASMVSNPDFAQYRFVIAGVSTHEESFYRAMVGQNVDIVFGQTYNLLRVAKAALVTSGTATLETALFGVPEVVCYKGSKISYLIAKHLIKGISYISLVNLVVNKEVVKELIQHEMNSENVKKELNLILNDSQRLKQIQEDYALLKIRLGEKGASQRTADFIIDDLAKKK